MHEPGLHESPIARHVQDHEILSCSDNTAQNRLRSTGIRFVRHVELHFVLCMPFWLALHDSWRTGISMDSLGGVACFILVGGTAVRIESVSAVCWEAGDVQKSKSYHKGSLISYYYKCKFKYSFCYDLSHSRVLSIVNDGV